MQLRKKSKKAQNQRSHAIKRARQHYDLYFTDHDINTIINMIQSKKSYCLESKSKRVSIHYLIYKGTEMRVVYDKTHKELSTILPLEPRQQDAQIPEEVRNNPDCYCNRFINF